MTVSTRPDKKIAVCNCSRNTLQSLTGRRLRVDGERELVDHNHEHQDDGREGGGEGDVPTFDGSPRERLGDGARHGSAVDGGSADAVGGGAVDELAARAVHAVLGVVLEGLDHSDVHKEGDDDGDEDQSAEEHSDHTGQGHADGEDELVADAVKEEGEEEGQKDESRDQSDEDESLRGLGHVAERIAEGVVLECARADCSGNGDDGLDSVQVIVDLGGVDLGAGGSQRGGGARAGGGGLLLEVEVLLELVPGGNSSGDHESHDRGREHNCAAVTGVECGRHSEGRLEGGWAKKE